MWYNRVVQDLAQIPPFIDYYEKQLIAAKSEISISGNVEKAVSNLPGITEYLSLIHISEPTRPY